MSKYEGRRKERVHIYLYVCVCSVCSRPLCSDGECMYRSEKSVEEKDVFFCAADHKVVFKCKYFYCYGRYCKVLVAHEYAVINAIACIVKC